MFKTLCHFFLFIIHIEELKVLINHQTLLILIIFLKLEVLEIMPIFFDKYVLAKKVHEKKSQFCLCLLTTNTLKI